MLTIFHASDVHFGPPYIEAVGEAVLQAAHALEPDVIVVSGDFTQRAKEEQFRAARSWLDRLPPLPTIVTPGNHDVPVYRVVERLFSPYRWYHEYISEELDSFYRSDEVAIVALNSTKPLRAITNGRVSQWQLDYASRCFEDVPAGIPRIIVSHHHFAPAPDYEGGQVMPKAKRALDRFTDLRVDLILGGHLHRAYIGNSLDVYPGKDRDHGIIIVESGTSTSRRGRAREREKNSFNVIRVGDEVIRITHYMYFDDAPGFRPMSRHIFPRADRRFFADAEPGTPRETDT